MPLVMFICISFHRNAYKDKSEEYYETEPTLVYDRQIVSILLLLCALRQ